MLFRLEKEEDYYNIENLTREAFWNVYRPGCDEHLVLHKLRNLASFIPELDYIAEIDGKMAGHIAYSRMFHGDNRLMSEEIIGFGPISVLPEAQKMGIGRELIHFSMQKAKDLGYKAVLITGSDQYYPKLGFEKASSYNIYLPGMEGQEASFFMAKELEKGYLSNHAGVYDFDSCFKVNAGELEDFEKKFPEKVKREPRITDLD